MSEKVFSTSDFLEQKMNKKLREHPDSVVDFFCTYQFEIGEGIWNLDLTGKEKKIVRGKHPEPDCTICLSDENFEKLLHKKLNVPLALVTGKIKIRGDKSLALKLGELFE